MSHSNGDIILKIIDDGKGFDKEMVSGKKSLGLLGMEERVFMLGGTFKISSEPGKGTTVTVSLPYSSNEEVEDDGDSVAF